MNLRQLPTEDQTRETLHWIVGVLRRNQIPFQIVGGLAARAYGSTRALVDIDLYVPGPCLQTLAIELTDHIVRQPAHVVEDVWDLTYMALFRGIQKVEIGSADEPHIYDKRTQIWIKQVIHFDRSVEVPMYGLKLPVMPIEQLVEYKKILGRPVDVEDIRLLRNEY